MAKFDTSSIAGFDGMTTEQKLDALLGAEIPDAVDLSKYISKEVFDKKASEAAALSKQLKDKLSEDEKNKLEADESNKKILEELENLRKDKAVSEYTAKYLALGYDEALAKETAEAMQAGNMEKVFANGEKHKKALEEKIKKELIDKTPKPDGNGGGGHDDDDDFAVRKAKEIAKSRTGGGKQQEEILKNYLK